MALRLRPEGDGLPVIGAGDDGGDSKEKDAVKVMSDEVFIFSWVGQEREVFHEMGGIVHINPASK